MADRQTAVQEQLTPQAPQPGFVNGPIPQAPANQTPLQQIPQPQQSKPTAPKNPEKHPKGDKPKKTDCTLEYLKRQFDLAAGLYAEDFKRMHILDQVAEGDLWKAIGAVYPPYQILPDTNHVEFITSNIISNIYTVQKSAQLIPTSDFDKSLIHNLNCILDEIWSTHAVGDKQFEAGSWAALVNLGITQVGWQYNYETKKDELLLKNIEPFKFMRDPYATEFKYARWCCTFDEYDETYFTSNPNYKEKFLQYKLSKSDKTSTGSAGASYSFSTGYMPSQEADRKLNAQGKEGYYQLVVFYVRNEDGGVDEYHTIANEVLLLVRHDIKPSTFPFALLYCRKPKGHRLIGASPAWLILKNSIVENMLDSIMATYEYRNQRPPKFINSESGINTEAFLRYGNDPDKTFLVNGDASKAVHYAEFPMISPNAFNLGNKLDVAIKNITGITDRYTGASTGSITTTGGMQDALNKLSVIDTPKIQNYESYTRQLTKLIISNYIQFAPVTKFFTTDEAYAEIKPIEIPFPDIDDDTVFNYQLMISSDLPRSKQMLAEKMTEIMEKQMQYGRDNPEGVDLLTPEEWLMFQDIPNKRYLTERMKLQRSASFAEQISESVVLFNEFLKQGAEPDDAITMAAQAMQQQRQGINPEQVTPPNMFPQTPIGESPLPPDTIM